MIILLTLPLISTARRKLVYMNDNPRVLNFYHLLNYCFNIPEYQRGYRWEKKQVEDLLNDIKDFIDKRSANLVKENEFYCLQPVVVYKTGDYNYDVIDGQQRLTTLYLILQALKNGNDILVYTK